MIFTSHPDGYYTCDGYKIEHEVAGFGIALATIYHDGNFLKRFSGPNSLDQATEFCRQRERGV